MLPSYKPSPDAAASRPGEQRAVQSPPDASMGGMNHDQLGHWGDTSNQLDYFASAGYSHDTIYNTALTPGGTFVAISPIRKSSSSNPANASMPPTAVSYPSAGAHAYPTQELSRPSFESLPSPPGLGASSFQPPPLPPPRLDILAGVASGAPGLTQGAAGLTSGAASGATATGLTQDVLDSFELDGPDAVPSAGAGTKTEGLGDYEHTAPAPPARISTSPCTTSKARGKKKSKGKAKKGGAIRVTKLDILRGRGGMTNRHPGNARFRDEARAMRAEYRDASTSRKAKFELSKVLVRRVREYGGRFLEKNADDKWVEMNETDARKKASQVLREEKWD